MNLDEIKFDAHGLIPAIVQDYYTKKVLTLAYMNRESLEIQKGLDEILKKVGEECTEVIIAAKSQAGNGELIYELADLYYHALVLMLQQGVTVDQVKILWTIASTQRWNLLWPIEKRCFISIIPSTGRFMSNTNGAPVLMWSRRMWTAFWVIGK